MFSRAPNLVIYLKTMRLLLLLQNPNINIKNQRIIKKRANDEVSTKLTCQITSMERTISDLVQSFNSFRELAMEKLVANEENWRQLKTANETSKVSKAPIDVNDIRRPPPVGYVRVDNDMIHLGRGIWLPQATFNNDIYTAGSSLAMVVKNIAVSVFGVEYLKSHSVKGKGSNKTKSIPRPAIDPTKALAIRDIFEYYLKTERKMTGQALMNEVDLYEEYIRQKISDLLRPPRQANKNNKKSEASQKNVTHDKNDVPAAASGDMNPELNTTNPTNNTHDNQLTSSEKSSVGDSSSSEGSSGSSDEESKSASDDSIE
ncbi:uncharacterized protein LOC141528643 [Cotesia typhae]|uniref:uncharacterized protein LOC141528643 n=2 Tax=Cotesia typhae TaxID=2053667 RepID=UPI003D68F83F